MAIIYETQDDLTRDSLKEQTLKAQLKSERQASSGLALVGGSLLANFFQDRKPETRGWLSYLSLGLSIAGITQTIRSWLTSSKASTLDAQRQAMGPQMVILPPSDSGITNSSCGCSHDKLHAQPIGAKSLLDQATRPDDLTPGKY